MKTITSFPNDFASISCFLEWWLNNEVLPSSQQVTFNSYYRHYKTHFGPYLQFNYANQVKEVEELLLQKPNAKLLEIGVGCGTESLWFTRLGADVTAIDIKLDRLETAKTRKDFIERVTGKQQNLTLKKGSIFDLEFPQKFDIIWMEQALHHIEPRNQIFELIYKLLKLDGKVVISEANAFNPLLQYKLFKKRGFDTLVEMTDENGKTFLYGNERILTPYSLTKGLEKHGIYRNKLRYFRCLPHIKFADKVLGLEKNIPQFLTPIFTHYNYVGSKSSSSS